MLESASGTAMHLIIYAALPVSYSFDEFIRMSSFIL